MASSNLILRLQLQDNLSPGVRESIQEIQRLNANARDLQSQVQTMRDNRRGVLGGSIDSDIASIATLQARLRQLRATQITTPTRQNRADITSANADLVSAYNREITRLTQSERDLARQTREANAQLDHQNRQSRTTTTARGGRVSSTLDTQAIVEANNRATQSFDATRDSMVRTIRQINTLVAGYYLLSGAMNTTLGVGHEYNKLMEQENIGLQLLISQNLKYVDVLGQTVTAEQKYAFSRQEANKSIELAKEINVQTPHNLIETLQIFKLLTPQVLKYGGSLEQTAELTKRVSIVASAMGVEYDNLLKTVDSALTGEMLPSGLQRSLAQFGVTNAKIKELKKSGGDVVEFVISSLEMANVAGNDIFNSWAGRVGQFQNEWHSLWGELQKPLFELAKQQLSEFTVAIRDNKEEIISTVGTIVTLTKHALILYGAYKLSTGIIAITTRATALLNATIVASNRASLIQARYTRITGVELSRLTIIARTTRTAMAGLGATMRGNLPMIAVATALTVAFEVWNSEMEETSRRLSDVEKVSSSTREELALLDNQAITSLRSSVDAQIENTKSKIEELQKALKTANASFMQKGTSGGDFLGLADMAGIVGIYDAITGSAKEQTDQINKQLEAEREKLKLYTQSQNKMQSMSQELIDHTRAVEEIKRAITETRDLISSNTEIINQNKGIDEQAVLVAQEKIVKLQAQKAEQLNQLRLENLLLASAGGIVVAYNQGTEALVGANKQLVLTLSNAFKLKSAMLGYRNLMGEVSDIEMKNTLHAQKLADIAKTKAGDDRKTAELIENTRYGKEIIALNKQTADKQREIDNALRADKIANLNAHGNKAKSIQLQIEAINAKQISDAQKKLQIDTLLTTEKNKNAKSSARSTKANATAGTKATREHNKAIKEQIDLMVVQSKLAISQRDLQIAMYGRLKYQVETDRDAIQLAKAQVEEAKNVLNKATSEGGDSSSNAIRKKIIEAEIALNGAKKKLFEEEHKRMLETAKEFKDIVSGSFDDLLSGDFNKAFGDIFNKSLDALVAPVGDVFSTMMGNLFTGDKTGGIVDAISNLSIGNIVGVGVKILSGIFSSQVSQAEIDASKGRSDFNSETLANLSSMYESVQYPLLKETREMKSYIQSMDSNFISVARAITGKIGSSNLDLTGANFVDTSSEGFLGFSSKQVSLIGTGLKLEIDSLSNMMNEASINMKGYTSSLVEKSSFFGLINSSSIQEQITNLPKSVTDDVAGIFADGYSQILLASTTLGFDEATIKKALLESEVAIGKIDFTGLSQEEVSNRFSQAISESFSNIVDGIDIISDLASQYQTKSEELHETFMRIAKEYSQASFSLTLIGKDLTRNLDNSVYTMQQQVLDIIQATGGESAFNSAMDAYTQNFFSDIEQADMLREALRTQFEAIGLALPKTSEEYRKKLESIDTSTQAGSIQYGEMLSLANGFADMSKALEQAGDSVDAYNEKLRNGMGAIAELWQSDLSYLTATAKADLASEYFNLARESNGVLSTLDSARALAEAKQSTTRTKEEYMPFFNQLVRETAKDEGIKTTDDLYEKLNETVNEIKRLQDITQMRA